MDEKEVEVSKGIVASEYVKYDDYDQIAMMLHRRIYPQIEKLNAIFGAHFKLRVLENTTVVFEGQHPRRRSLRGSPLPEENSNPKSFEDLITDNFPINLWLAFFNTHTGVRIKLDMLDEVISFLESNEKVKKYELNYKELHLYYDGVLKFCRSYDDHSFNHIFVSEEHLSIFVSGKRFNFCPLIEPDKFDPSCLSVSFENLPKFYTFLMTTFPKEYPCKEEISLKIIPYLEDAGYTVTNGECVLNAKGEDPLELSGLTDIYAIYDLLWKRFS